MNQKNENHTLSLREQVIMFFFGIILGKHYFANLGGSVQDKSRLLKIYYLGLLFWGCMIGIILFLESRDLIA